MTAGAVVLLYHRVASPRLDPLRLAVSADNFATHLQWLQANANPMPLTDVVAGLEAGDLPDRAVAITFDDGYADNLVAAVPLLEQFDVPASFFLVTGAWDRDREFWWDDLERVLLDSSYPTGRVAVDVDGVTYEADVSQPNGSDATGWSIADDDVPSATHRAYKDLYRLFRKRSPREREELIDQLVTQLGLSNECRPTHRVLSRSEVADIAARDQFTVAPHTVTHPLLSGLPTTEQRSEITESKIEVEAVTGRAASLFAYPYGGAESYTDDTVRLVREAGFGAAFTNSEEQVHAGRDLYRIERVGIPNWDEERFARAFVGLL